MTVFPAKQGICAVTMSAWALVCSACMEPSSSRSNFSLAGAGSVLIGTTAAVIVVAALIGWAAGSLAWGFLAGAILGIPAGIFSTYKRYGHAL